MQNFDGSEKHLCWLPFSPSVICLLCWPQNNAPIEKHNQPSSPTWCAYGIARWLASSVFRKINRLAGGRWGRFISREHTTERKEMIHEEKKTLSALERWLTTHPEAQQSKGQELFSSNDTDLKIKVGLLPGSLKRLSDCSRIANTVSAT